MNTTAIQSQTTTSTTSQGVIGQASMNLRALMIEAVSVQRGIDAKTGSVSDKLLTIAKAYQDKETIGKEDETNSDKFLNACATDEAFIKSSDAGDSQVDKLPRCYTQAKSNIKAALNYGINLDDYSSESALRKDVQKVRQGKGQSPLNAAMSTFKKEIESLPEAKAIELMKQFNALAKQALLELVPVEPVKVSTVSASDLLTTIMQALEVDKDMATALVDDGIESVQDVVEMGLDLADIDGIDDDLALELESRAVTFQLANTTSH